MATKNNTFVCPTCGRTSTEYKHNINKTLISCLWLLHKAGGRSRLDKLYLDNTQFTNFQKLQYFNLIVPGGKNEWQITRLGTAFLQGRQSVPKFVMTRNALVKLTSPERVFVDQVKESVQYKVQWQEQLEQPTLFDMGD